jgi:hypothetical protein
MEIVVSFLGIFFNSPAAPSTAVTHVKAPNTVPTSAEDRSVVLRMWRKWQLLDIEEINYTSRSLIAPDLIRR